MRKTWLYSISSPLNPLNPLPPSPPSGFTATAGKGYVNLAWNANSESNLATYQIYRSTAPGAGYQLLAAANSDKFTYADGDVVTGTAYYYVLQAVNTAAQPSGYSPEVSAMPEALAAPTGLTATPGKELVNLAWEASAEGHISSYNIYRTAEAGGDYALIGSIAAQTPVYTDTNVTTGVTYTYVVTAVNEWSKESGRSNPAAAIPEAVSVGVTITSPYNGAYSPTSTVLVKGTVESGDSPEVGVVLVVESSGKEGVLSSRYLAEVNNGSFAAPISLFPGMQNPPRHRHPPRGRTGHYGHHPLRRCSGGGSQADRPAGERYHLCADGDIRCKLRGRGQCRRDHHRLFLGFRRRREHRPGDEHPGRNLRLQQTRHLLPNGDSVGRRGEWRPDQGACQGDRVLGNHGRQYAVAGGDGYVAQCEVDRDERGPCHR